MEIGSSDSSLLISRLHERSREDKRPSINYLQSSRQGRQILINFIMGIADTYDLTTHTSSCAINYFDRYFDAMYNQTKHSLFQCESIQTNCNLSYMIASTCLFISAKFNDRQDKIITVSDLEQINNWAATKVELMELETEILTVLQWKLLIRRPHEFVDDIILLCERKKEKIKQYTLLFIDMSKYNDEYISYSHVTIAIISFISTCILLEYEYKCLQIYIDTLSYICNQTEEQLYICAKKLVTMYVSKLIVESA